MDTSNRPGPRGRAGDIRVEVPLTREQALQGGRVRIWIPVQFRCPNCQGRGGEGFFECLRCFGRGLIATEYPVEIAFPPGVVDRSMGRVSLGQPGMRDPSLKIYFRVHEW